MAFKYPKTFAAAQQAEISAWAIGDALLEECGAPGDDHSNNDSFAKLKEAQAELEANGIDYIENTLRRYRDTSHHFPHARRRASVSHAVHMECGSPEMLDALLEGWPHNKSMSRNECRQILAEIRRRRDEANEAEYNARRSVVEKKVEIATKRVEKAKEAVRTTNTLDERRKAEEKRKAEERKLNEAKEELHNVPKLPKGDPLAPPRPDTVPQILFSSQLLAAALDAKISAKKVIKMLEEAGDRTYDPDQMSAVIEAATETAKLWREISLTLQGKPGLKGSHLTVVGE